MFLDLVKQARSHRGFRQDRKVTRQELEHLVELAQQLADFYALHRFSASLAAAGNRAARRLNSGLVKYFRR